MLVIFDCDGVLVDSEPLANRILARHLRANGVALSDDEVMAAFRGRSAESCIRHMGQWMTAEAARRCWQALQAETLVALRAVEPIPGVLDQLARLEAHSVPFCVASSGDHAKMAVTLGATGILSRFAPRCFSVTEVAAPKPAPDVFLHAAATLGEHPDRCIVVEDSAMGVQAGVAAGMRVLWFGGPAQHDFGPGVSAFHCMSALPSLLGLVSARAGR